MADADDVLLRASTMTSAERHDLIGRLRALDVAAQREQRKRLRPQFAGWLKKARYTAGLTQSEVAKAMGLTRVAYTNYEAGRQSCTVEMFVVLCSCFGIEPGAAFAEMLASGLRDGE